MVTASAVSGVRRPARRSRRVGGRAAAGTACRRPDLRDPPAVDRLAHPFAVLLPGGGLRVGERHQRVVHSLFLAEPRDPLLGLLARQAQLLLAAFEELGDVALAA